MSLSSFGVLDPCVRQSIYSTMAASFHDLAELSEALAGTSRKLEKRDLIANWLRLSTVEDAALAALYLSGQPFAQTDRRALNLGGSLLTKAIMQLTAASPQELHQAYLRHGDLGAAAADLLTGREAIEHSLTLGDIERALAAIAVARGTQPKLHHLLQLLSRASALESKYLIKLALGDMRTGVRHGLMEEAIAAAYLTDPDDVRRAGMLLGDLREVVKLAAAGELKQARMRLFHPLGFMLASPVASVDDAVARFALELAEQKPQLALSAASLSDEDPRQGGSDTGQPEKSTPSAFDQESTRALDLSLAFVEDKYDGIRCQLHCGDPEQPGRVALFSRNREDITESFPELVTAFVPMSAPLILDGEILAWDPIQQRAKPFASVQQRIGRKHASRELQRSIPVVFMAFDILYSGTDLLLHEPLSRRRTLLKSIVDQHQSQTATGPNDERNPAQSSLFDSSMEDTFPRLLLSPAASLASAEQLDQAYKDARSRGNEGVMIKLRSSIYQPGRRGLAWLKLKSELATLDVVVTAAEFGHGKRARVLSDYTFAVRDGTLLRNVGKAYSGLTDEEIAKLTVFFHQHTLEDSGRVRTVEPLIVLEVAFNNVMRSDRHDSGFALRFPRIVRIRDDKPIDEIDTLARVAEIYNSQPDRPQDIESSDRASARDGEDVRRRYPPE
jgi:DNA ligase-1